MSQESKTPRTDAEASDAANYAPIEKGWYVHVDFACQLELELAAVTEERDALIASARINEANSGWRPIETAPKDGTIVLATWKETWGRGRQHIEPCEFVNDLWYYSFDGEYPTTDPTHWMPLPAPPTTEPDQ